MTKLDPIPGLSRGSRAAEEEEGNEGGEEEEEEERATRVHSGL